MGRIATKQITSLPASEITFLTKRLAKRAHKARTLKRARILLGFPVAVDGRKKARENL